MDLKKVESFFNELFDFNNLVKDASKYIEKILSESDTNFLTEDITDKPYSYKELKVKYNNTHLLINNTDSEPCFRLEFYLYKELDQNPEYTYEIEYNSSGDFLDEYFLEY